MPNDPKYVRLAEHLTRGGRYDLVSGWGVSGYNVVEMPDKDERPNAYRFARGELAAGRLEGASKAEYDEAHPDIVGTLGYKADDEDDARPYQEAEVQREAAKAHRKVKARRSGAAEGSAYDADQKRREETLKAQKSAVKTREKVEGARRAAAEDDGDDEDNDEYDAMDKAALVAEAEARGLAKSGSADAIRDRLRAHDAEDESDEDETEDDGDEDDDTEGDGSQS